VTIAKGSHTCPGPQCTVTVPYSQLACRRHWYQVPAAIRRAVYASWDYGRGAGSAGHAAALAAAVERMQP